MGTGPTKDIVRLADALARVPAEAELPFTQVYTHGSLEVELYAPRGQDLQKPHSRDEVYIVAHGSGEFVNGEERVAFGPGDFLFVPAGREHRFVGFTDDLAVWVLFYGPEGGERPDDGREIGP